MIAASERRRACWAAAVSAPRVLASAGEVTVCSDDRPVTGSYTFSVDVGTLSAARRRPRAAAACWTAVSSSARAYAPEPARGGCFSASCSARRCSPVIAAEYVSCAWRAVLFPVSAALRSTAMSSRSPRSEAVVSGFARSSSTCRSTRAPRCSEGAFALGRPAAMKTVTSSRSSASEWARVRASWVCAASVTRSWESWSWPEAVMTDGAPAPTIAAATTATATMSRLRTWAGRPRPAGSVVASPVALPAGAVCLPVRRGRVFCTGARIPDSCAHGPG